MLFVIGTVIVIMTIARWLSIMGIYDGQELIVCFRCSTSFNLHRNSFK
jgi:hypothetical protein